MSKLQVFQRADSPRKTLERALEKCDDMEEAIVFMVRRSSASEPTSVNSQHFSTSHSTVISILGMLELAKQDMIGKES